MEGELLAASRQPAGSGGPPKLAGGRPAQGCGAEVSERLHRSKLGRHQSGRVSLHARVVGLFAAAARRAVHIARLVAQRLTPPFSPHLAGYYECNGACISRATCCKNTQGLAACPADNPDCMCTADPHSECPSDGASSCVCSAGALPSGAGRARGGARGRSAAPLLAWRQRVPAPGPAAGQLGTLDVRTLGTVLLPPPFLAGFYRCNGACIPEATCCTDADGLPACPAANPDCKCTAAGESRCSSDGGSCVCSAGEQRVDAQQPNGARARSLSGHVTRSRCRGARSGELRAPLALALPACPSAHHAPPLVSHHQAWPTAMPLCRAARRTWRPARTGAAPAAPPAATTGSARAARAPARASRVSRRGRAAGAAGWRPSVLASRSFCSCQAPTGAARSAAAP